MISQDMAVRVAEVEKARRAKDYTKMQRLAGACLAELEGDQSPEVCKMRAKINYELHMAAFQQAKDTPGGSVKLLRLSMTIAEHSSAQAKLAKDLAGELFPQMNIGGHLLPALGRWKEGIGLLQSTLKKAKAGMSKASVEDAYRLSRVAMNCYLLLIDIAIANNGRPADVKHWQKAAEATAVFTKEYKDSSYGRERARKAQEFTKRKT